MSSPAPSPHGQGHVTAWAMLASEQLGIPIEHIEVIQATPIWWPGAGGPLGSRSLQAGRRGGHEAPTRWWTGPASWPPTCWRPTPTTSCSTRSTALPRGRHAGGGQVLGELAESRRPTRAASESSGSRRRPGRPFPSEPTWPWSRSTPRPVGCASTRLVAVDDAGTILNPLLAEGQRHGGLAQGAAQALYEEFRYDDDGNPVTSNLADYAMISADRAAQLRAGRHGDADADQRARGQGHR